MSKSAGWIEIRRHLRMIRSREVGALRKRGRTEDEAALARRSGSTFFLYREDTASIVVDRQSRYLRADTVNREPRVIIRVVPPKGRKRDLSDHYVVAPSFPMVQSR